ncbi:MAG: polysaccharide deacetylase family protein [Ramlibacter sp.]|nr:polysaccharide deacetylase family protein [Ramlibacter sp.]
MNRLLGGYSPIVNRPPLRWPNGARLALWIVPNIEHYPFAPLHGAMNPYPRMPHPDVYAYGLRDYGNRVGFWRMLEVLDRHQVKGTLSLNIACYENYPEVRAACEARGYDVMSHGIFNTDHMFDMSSTQQRDYIADCQARFRAAAGRDFTGWFSPANTGTPETVRLAADAGLSYTSDLFHDDQPTLVADGRIVSLPYSMDLNDGWNFRSSMEAADFVRATLDQFECLYAEGGRVMCLPLHPYVLGQPHRIAHLDRLLEQILAREGVWQATGAEIADWFRRQPAAAVEVHP